MSASPHSKNKHLETLDPVSFLFFHSFSQPCFKQSISRRCHMVWQALQSGIFWPCWYLCRYSCEHFIVTRNALRILVCKKTIECHAGKWPGWGQAGQQLSCVLESGVTLPIAKDESNWAEIREFSSSLKGPHLHTSPILSPLTQDLPDKPDTD